MTKNVNIKWKLEDFANPKILDHFNLSREDRDTVFAFPSSRITTAFDEWKVIQRQQKRTGGPDLFRLTPEPLPAGWLERGQEIRRSGRIEDQIAARESEEERERQSRHRSHSASPSVQPRRQAVEGDDDDGVDGSHSDSELNILASDVERRRPRRKKRRKESAGV